MIGNNMKEWVKLIVIGLLSLFPFLCFGQGPEEALTKSIEPKKAPEKSPEPAPEAAPALLGGAATPTAPAPTLLPPQPVLPGKKSAYDFQNHNSTWDDSPFSRRIVEPPPPPAKETGPSPWEGWKLAAVDKFGDSYTVGLTTKKGEFRLLKMGEETEDGVKLTKVESNGVIGETTIFLSGNGHSGPLTFDVKRLSAPVKGAPVPKKAVTKTTGKLPQRPPGISDDKAAAIKKQQEAARAKIREQMLKARSQKSSNDKPQRRVTLPPPRK